MTESFQQGENLSADKLNRNFKEVDNINGSEFISVNRTSGGKQVSLNVHSLEGRLSKSQIEYGKVLATYKPEAIYITLKPCYPSGTDFPYTVNERWKVHLTSNRDYPKDIYYAKDDVIAFKRYANPIGDIVGVVIGLPHQVVFALELCENSSTVQLTNDISFANALDSVVKLDDNHCYKCRLATQAEKAALTIKAITSDNSLGVFDTCSECNTRYL